MNYEANHIYNVNCMDMMNNLDNITYDLILTDPPYNISMKNNLKTMKGRSGIDFGDWDKNFDLTSWIPLALNNLKSNGSIIIFSAWKNMTILSDVLEENNCIVKEMIQWRKTNPMPRNRDRLYVTACEFAIWAVKGRGWTFNRQRDTYENTIFTYPIVSSKDRIHPTQKSVDLISDLIKIHSNENDLVFDPFMGSGTTAIAAIMNNRRYLGCELSTEYYTAANQRILNYTS